MATAVIQSKYAQQFKQKQKSHIPTLHTHRCIYSIVYAFVRKNEQMNAFYSRFRNEIGQFNGAWVDASAVGQILVKLMRDFILSASTIIERRKKVNPRVKLMYNTEIIEDKIAMNTQTEREREIRVVKTTSVVV